MNDLRTQTVHSLNWTMVAQVIRELLRFIISVTLARVLGPDVFGQIAMVYIVTGFARLLTNMGLGDAAIQSQSTSEEQHAAVFWASLCAGLTMTVLVALISPAVAALFRCPALQLITLVLSLDFIIASLLVLPNALLRKEMRFKQLAIIESLSVIIAGFTAIGMACKGMGVWSLVAYSMVASALTTLATWLVNGPANCRMFRFAALKRFLPFGLNLMGVNILNYLSRQVDNLLIGRQLGALSLGYYSRAYNLMLLPVLQINQVVTHVMFSALCRIQGDKERIARVYLRSIRLISFVTFPLMLGMCVTAEPFVLAIFGEEWRPAVPLLRLLSIVGMYQSVNTTCGWLFRSQGRTDLLLRWTILSSTMTCIAFIVGIRWGAQGVAAAYALCTSCILWYPLWRLAGGLVGLSFSTMARHLAGNFAAAATMAAFVLLVHQTCLPEEWPQALQLVVLVTAGALSYGILVHVTGNPAYTELRMAAIARIRSRERRGGGTQVP